MIVRLGVVVTILMFGTNFLIEISYFELVWLIYRLAPKLMNLLN